MVGARLRCAAGAAALVISYVAGCGGGGGEDADEPVPVTTSSTMVEAEVDRRGGVLELESRARVTIPPDALEEPVTIRVRTVGRAELPERPAEEYSELSMPLVIEPHGLELRRPASVELTLEESAEQTPEANLRMLRLEDERDRTYEDVGEIRVLERDEQAPAMRDLELRRTGEDTVSRRRRVEATVETFSVFVAAEQQRAEDIPDAATPEAGADMDGGTTLVDGGPRSDATIDAGPAAPGAAVRRRLMAATRETSAYIDDSGKLWTFGSNRSGQLGNGTQRAPAPHEGIALAPIPLESFVLGEVFVDVTAGENFFLALTEGGDLYAWGNNDQGQIGNGAQSTDQVAPTLILSNVVTADAGPFGAVAYDESGTLFSWGRNQAIVPTAGPTIAAELVQLAMGQDHTLALDRSGQVWSWGGNGQGQLGDGTTTDRPTPEPVTLADGTTPLDGIVQIDTGDQFSVALDAEGQVWSFGANTFGQLASGDRSGRNVPELIRTGSAPAFSQIAATYRQVLALGVDGTGWGWGNNGNGELASSTPDCSGSCSTLPVAWVGAGPMPFVDVAAGYSHALAIKSDGEMAAWGLGSQGQLGTGSRPSQPQPPSQVVLPTGRVPEALRMEHNTDSPRSGFLFDDGLVWVAGRHGVASGTLTEGSSPALVSGLVGNRIIDYCTGGQHAVAVDETGAVYTFGANNRGQLGNGDTGVTSTDVWLQVSFPQAANVVRVGCSIDTSYALDDQNRLWAWGDDVAGQLGQSVTALAGELSAEPIRVAGVNGAGTLDNVVDFEGSIGSPSREHAAAVLDDGTVVVWGAFQNTSLGRTAQHTCSGSGFACQRVPLRVCAPGTSDLGDCDDTGDGPGAQFLSGIEEVAVGSGTVFARGGNTLYSWGQNVQGHLGQGSEDTPNVVATEITTPLSGNIVQIESGSQFAMALNDQGDVYVWGNNNFGQLGKGDQDDVSCTTNASCSRVPALMPLLDAIDVIAIEAGHQHAGAIDAQGRVWTWGSNANGQLGHQVRTSASGGVASLSPVEVVLLPR